MGNKHVEKLLRMSLACLVVLHPEFPFPKYYVYKLTHWFQTQSFRS